MRNTIGLMAASTAVLFALAACGGDDVESAAPDVTTDEGVADEEEEEVTQYPADSKLGQVQAAGTLIVGTKFSAPPFGFKDPGSDDVLGFMPDISRELAHGLGVEVRFTEATVDNRIPLLQEGAVDLSVDTMVMTCARAEQIDFSIPYYLSQARVLVDKSSGIEELEDLNGKTVATPAGSYMIETLEEAAPEVNFNFMDDYAQMGQLLVQGQIDGITTDDSILTGLIVQNDDLHMIGDSLGEGPYGIGVAKGNDDLLEYVNTELARMLQDGTWEELHGEWIERYTGEPAVDPSSTSVEDALAANPCS